MPWIHYYRPSDIPTAGQGSAISNHSPGKKIATTLTEIQDRTINEIEVKGDANIDVTASIINNKLHLEVTYKDTTDPVLPDPHNGHGLPVDGEEKMVLTRGIGDVLDGPYNGSYHWDWLRAVDV